MTPIVALDLKRITAEVAARHGMLLRPDDPAMLLVTMNEVVLQQVIGSIEARAEEMVAGMEAVLRSWRSRGCGLCSATSSNSWTQFHLFNESECK